MHSIIQSGTLVGVDGLPVQVEIDLLRRLPCITIVGLPDNAVRESGDRVRSAIQQSGFEFPRKRVIINLAPAGIRKQGPLFDLPIAVGILIAQQSDRFDKNLLCRSLFIGELSLSGKLRPIRGALSITLMAKNSGLKRVVLPIENATEARGIEDIEICPFSTLREVILWLNGKQPPGALPEEPSPTHSSSVDLSEVRGQAIPRRALEIAAAGGHNLIFWGSPGCGKSMLAMRMPTILPELSQAEAIDITRIHSAAGAHHRSGLMTVRPFRAPHHSTTVSAMIGNAKLIPGEATLAHNGVLFLDEIAEFRRDVLEALRGPLENKRIQLTRANGSILFPANFSLISAANPCPCGWRFHPHRECICSPAKIARYQAKLSGPIRDRIDIHVWVSPVPLTELVSGKEGETSADVRLRVNIARRVQQNRYRQDDILSNAALDGHLVEKYTRLSRVDQHWFRSVLERNGLSARAWSRTLKVARTIADLAQSECVMRSHLVEALSYRDEGDRK